MNLSPEWVQVLRSAGIEAVHWSTVGNPSAPDTELFEVARKQRSVMMTQDLDFTELLYHSRAGSPSVVLLRLRNELHEAQRTRVAALLQAATSPLEAGALLVINERRARLRRLPILEGPHG